MSNQYVLKMIAYNGINIPLLEGTWKECQERAKKRIEYYKRRLGGTVTRLNNFEWEMSPPDTAILMSDCDGYLKIVRYRDG